MSTPGKGKGKGQERNSGGRNWGSMMMNGDSDSDSDSDSFFPLPPLFSSFQTKLKRTEFGFVPLQTRELGISAKEKKRKENTSGNHKGRKSI